MPAAAAISSRPASIWPLPPTCRSRWRRSRCFRPSLRSWPRLPHEDRRPCSPDHPPRPGGHRPHPDKPSPPNDCAMCTTSPKLVDVGRHPNIDLLVDSEVLEVEGQAGGFSLAAGGEPRPAGAPEGGGGG